MSLTLDVKARGERVLFVEYVDTRRKWGGKRKAGTGRSSRWSDSLTVVVLSRVTPLFLSTSFPGERFEFFFFFFSENSFFFFVDDACCSLREFCSREVRVFA